jgi:RNA polymerase sigma-70 factor, ECF subfamily
MLSSRWVVDGAFGGSSARGEEQGTFERLFLEHGAFVARVLRRFGVRPSDVADASQDVFLVVHRKLDDFEARASHRTWLYRICVRVAADYRKRAHRRYERLEHPIADVAVLSDAESDAAHAELVARLERALDTLPHGQRQVFALYELEELTMPEVAELLGCPLKTAFSRLYAARGAVRDALRRAGYALPLAALPVPWKVHAGGELRAALDGIGAGGGCFTPLLGAAAITPLAKVAPLAAHAGAAGAALSHAVALTSAAGVIAVAALSLPAWSAEQGAVLTHAAASRQEAARGRTVRYHVALPPLPAPVLDHATVPAQVPAVPSVRRVRAAEIGRRAIIQAEAAAQAPVPLAREPAAPSGPAPEPRWIRAPEPPASQVAASAPRAPAVGLDEVLDATSIAPLTRVAPQREGVGRAFTLVPARAPEARTRAQRGLH